MVIQALFASLRSSWCPVRIAASLFANLDGKRPFPGTGALFPTRCAGDLRAVFPRREGVALRSHYSRLRLSERNAKVSMRYHITELVYSCCRTRLKLWPRLSSGPDCRRAGATEDEIGAQPVANISQPATRNQQPTLVRLCGREGAMAPSCETPPTLRAAIPQREKDALDVFVGCYVQHRNAQQERHGRQGQGHEPQEPTERQIGNQHGGDGDQ